MHPVLVQYVMSMNINTSSSFEQNMMHYTDPPIIYETCHHATFMSYQSFWLVNRVHHNIQVVITTVKNWYIQLGA